MAAMTVGFIPGVAIEFDRRCEYRHQVPSWTGAVVWGDAVVGRWSSPDHCQNSCIQDPQ